MDIDAEMRRKIIVSLAATVSFVVLLVSVGTRYGTDPTPETPGGVVLQQPGGTYLVALFGLFVLLMAGVGIYLDRTTE
ncbi:MAG: hypothetical protein ABEI99_07915 [Halobaculum sp.]